jgi:hypothetical protein
MASNFVFKKTETTNMKIAGFIDTDKMMIEVDGIYKKLSTLLSAFNGTEIEINVKVKSETELDEPISDNETEVGE